MCYSPDMETQCDSLLANYNNYYGYELIVLFAYTFQGEFYC